MFATDTYYCSNLLFLKVAPLLLGINIVIKHFQPTLNFHGVDCLNSVSCSYVVNMLWIRVSGGVAILLLQSVWQ